MKKLWPVVFAVCLFVVGCQAVAPYLAAPEPVVVGVDADGNPITEAQPDPFGDILNSLGGIATAAGVGWAGLGISAIQILRQRKKLFKTEAAAVLKENALAAAVDAVQVLRNDSPEIREKWKSLIQNAVLKGDLTMSEFTDLVNTIKSEHGISPAS